MTKNELSHRAVLGALVSLPAVVVAEAMAGSREEFSAGLARKPQVMGFATSLQTSQVCCDGTVQRSTSAFGHRYEHWFDGDGMVQAFAFSGDKVIHRARVLDTPKRRRETRADKRIMPAFATPGSEIRCGAVNRYFPHDTG